MLSVEGSDRPSDPLTAARDEWQCERGDFALLDNFHVGGLSVNEGMSVSSTTHRIRYNSCVPATAEVSAVPIPKRCVCLFLFAVLTSASVSAQTVTITSGFVAPWWDASLSGLQLTGAGTQLVGEFLGGPAAASFTPGTRGDLNGSISLNPNTSNHTFQETVNGTTYPSVWITANLTFTTQPMLIPSAPEGATTRFSTPFTVSGQFSGYADRNLTQQIFSVSAQGSGVASSLGMTMRSGAWVADRAGQQLYAFTGPLPSPWTSADVGAAGTPGISSFGGGVFYVAGAGGDVWGGADSFQFVSQPLAGDGTIVAQVNAEQMTSPFAKAGVMIRRTEDAASADVILDVKPDGGIEFMTRASTGGSTSFIAGGSITSSAWLKLTRAGSTVTAAVSTDGTTWTTLGTATLAGGALVGLAVTSHDTTVLNQSLFTQVSVTASGGGGALPISWSHADVGAVGIAGDATFSGGTYTVSGAGADIWGTADAFHYAYTPMNSGGFVEARVVNEANTNTFAKAGVMFRDSLDPGATDVILDAKPDGSVEFMTRSAAGGSTTFIAGMQTSFPVSLKLQRNYATVNSIFIAFVLDSESNTWQQIGSVEIPMGPTATAGLAVTSHDTSLLNTATFDMVEVETNLLVESSFEGYTPPMLGPPGWISDTPLRAIDAVSDTHPRNGSQNGACIQTTFQDCGMYQEVVAPADGSYTLSFFAVADRGGALVGANVNGQTAAFADVSVGPQGDYGSITLQFSATAGSKIRVWMYSPASPGFVDIDDVSLTQDFAN